MFHFLTREKLHLASGMVAGVLYGKSYEQALGWGIKNATAVLAYVGAKKGLLTLGQINR